MSLLNHLVFQLIDNSADDIPVNHQHEDNIVLKEQIKEADLEHYWEQVVDDLHRDPEWDTFAED